MPAWGGLGQDAKLGVVLYSRKNKDPTRELSWRDPKSQRQIPLRNFSYSQIFFSDTNTYRYLQASPQSQGYVRWETIYPFILRGVSLLGIDSAECPMDVRRQVWHRISREWKLDQLDVLATECSLEALEDNIDLMLEGQLKGRVVVNPNA